METINRRGVTEMYFKYHPATGKVWGTFELGEKLTKNLARCVEYEKVEDCKDFIYYPFPDKVEEQVELALSMNLSFCPSWYLRNDHENIRQSISRADILRYKCQLIALEELDLFQDIYTTDIVGLILGVSRATVGNYVKKVYPEMSGKRKWIKSQHINELFKVAVKNVKGAKERYQEWLEIVN